MTMDDLGSLNDTLAELLGDLPDAVLVLDTQGRVQWGNHAAERLFDRTLHESVGLSGLELVHPDDLELVLRSLASVQRKEIGTLIEVRAKAATGWRLLEVIGAAVTWFGEPAALFNLRDLTERRGSRSLAEKKPAFDRSFRTRRPSRSWSQQRGS
jgi:PAS domain S-box-containing protein